MNIEILYKSKNAIVIYKPPIIPSQPDQSNDKDALSFTKEILRSSSEREELYLINRLDRVVGGLLLFARNKRSAAELTQKLSCDDFVKEYLAVVDGTADSGTFIDYLKKDSVRSMGIVTDESDKNAKIAKTIVRRISNAENKDKTKTLLKIRLLTGRFHQIRTQMSSRGTPISGDKKYGSRDYLARQPALFSYHLSVEVLGEKIDVYRLPPVDKYPWNLFSADNYDLKTEEYI